MGDNPIEEWLRELRNEHVLPQERVLRIIEAAEVLLAAEKNMLEISGKVSVIGDLHGQFYDFLHLLELVDAGSKILCLGDYVDRGYNSVELILYILLMKILEPERVFLLRGNHENRAQTSAYGFATECVTKYSYFIYWKICDLFEYLPMTAIINGKYFCVHGGITPGLTIKEITSQNRVGEFTALGPIMWCDPSDQVEYFQESTRGAGYLFGSKATEAFLKDVGCDYLVRSHQLVYDGILEQFDGKCITVWSAPNYCYTCKNLAAIMIIENNTHNYIFFDAVPEQYKSSN